MNNSKCSHCGAIFGCNITDASKCWCNQLPALIDVTKTANCLCPECLTQQISSKIDKFIASNSLQVLLDTASQYKANHELIEQIDYTIENGYMVFSKWYHLKRGSCCGNGCRHCPYS